MLSIFLVVSFVFDFFLVLQLSAAAELVHGGQQFLR